MLLIQALFLLLFKSLFHDFLFVVTTVHPLPIGEAVLPLSGPLARVIHFYWLSSRPLFERIIPTTLDLLSDSSQWKAPSLQHGLLRPRRPIKMSGTSRVWEELLGGKKIQRETHETTCVASHRDRLCLHEDIHSISEEPGKSGPGTESGSGSRPRTRGFTNSSGRPTVRWPFHSFNNSRSSIRYTSSLRHTRSGSLPQRAASSISRSVSSILGSDVIPDYVVHFLRGETPESLARKHRIPESPDTSNFPNQNFHFESPGNGNFLMSDGSRAATPRAEMEKMLQDQKPPTTFKKLTSGWRGGVTLNALLAFSVFVAAIVCLAFAGAKGKISGGGSSVVDGDVSKVRGANWGIHALVNIFAVVLVAAANYVVQILSSPTRCEVDTAHEKLTWVDIGIPSLRNLRLISSTRAALSATLLVLAVGSQIM